MEHSSRYAPSRIVVRQILSSTYSVTVRYILWDTCLRYGSRIGPPVRSIACSISELALEWFHPVSTLTKIFLPPFSLSIILLHLLFVLLFIFSILKVWIVHSTFCFLFVSNYLVLDSSTFYLFSFLLFILVLLFDQSTLPFQKFGFLMFLPCLNPDKNFLVSILIFRHFISRSISSFIYIFNFERPYCTLHILFSILVLELFGFWKAPRFIYFLSYYLFVSSSTLGNFVAHSTFSPYYSFISNWTLENFILRSRSF